MFWRRDAFCPPIAHWGTTTSILMKQYVLLYLLMFATAGSLCAQITFSFSFSGEPFENNASATGSITFVDLDVLQSSEESSFSIGGPEVLAINLTVTGSGLGNGNYTTEDFDYIYFWVPGPLDLGQDLVGQSNGIFGSSTWGTDSGEDGDFNLFGASLDAPYGVNYFTLSTQSGEYMQLTSFTSAVPEPSSYAALIGVMALGFVSCRRRSRAYEADKPGQAHSVIL